MATILVVDDDPVVQRMIVYVLEEEGYMAQRANNALEALEYLNEDKACDLMICDVKMPDMNGLELLEQVRRDESYGKLPVIMLTARPRVYDDAGISDSTRTAFLTKPISSDDLIEAVARHLA